MKKVDVSGLTMNSLNEEIIAKIGNEILNTGKPIVYAEGSSKSGHKSLFVIQNVSVAGLTELENVTLSFATAAFAGQSRDRLVRVITTVPTTNPLGAGDIVENGQIELIRNLDPFFDRAATDALVPSNVVLNPRTGMVSAIGGQPIFEHRRLILKKDTKAPNIKHDFANLNEMRIEGDTQTAVEREYVFELLVNLGVPEERAQKAAQLDFVPADSNSEVIRTI